MSDPVMEDRSMNDKQHPELGKSDVIKRLPKVCGDETAAVECFERQRWGNSPVCPHCQNHDVYKMAGRTGARNQRHLWRCRACGGAIHGSHGRDLRRFKVAGVHGRKIAAKPAAAEPPNSNRSHVQSGVSAP
jgi:hypothetical protein